MSWLRTAVLWNVDSWLGAWWQFRYTTRPRDPRQLGTGDRAPVLLLPGVYEPWEFMLPIGRRLHEAGHPVHALPALGHNRIPIPDAAALAQRYLEHHDLRSVAVVGHSKGGIIGKHMMAVDDAAGRIARLVAIASPFSGSRLARYAPVSTLRAFRGTDPMLTTLAGNLAANSRITSIYGEFDPMVPERSHLDGATNVELPVVGHFSVLRDRRVLEAVLAAIDPA
ncbi:hypothetical protein BH11ACT4_BH11ACT4_10260 [soil metagenome]